MKLTELSRSPRSLVQEVEGLLLGIMGDVVPGARRYPAEETETRLLAPASLSAGAAIPGLADSQLLGSARTDRKQQVCRDDLQDNSTHANQRSQASMDGVPEPDDDGTNPTLQPGASASLSQQVIGGVGEDLGVHVDVSKGGRRTHQSHVVERGK